MGWCSICVRTVRFPKTPSKELQATKGNMKLIFESQEFYIPLIPGYPFQLQNLISSSQTRRHHVISGIFVVDDLQTGHSNRRAGTTSHPQKGSILHDPQKFPVFLDGMSTNIMKNYKYRETCKLTLKGIKHLPIVDVYRKWVMFFPLDFQRQFILQLFWQRRLLGKTVYFPFLCAPPLDSSFSPVSTSNRHSQSLGPSGFQDFSGYPNPRQKTAVPRQ